MGIFDRGYENLVGLGMEKTKILAKGKRDCKSCLWCWEKSLISKLPEDDGVYGCYCKEAKKFHEFGIEKGNICNQYVTKKAKDDPRCKYE